MPGAPAADPAGSASHACSRAFEDGPVPALGVAAGLSTAAAPTGPAPRAAVRLSHPCRLSRTARRG
jgi:hypothetical protein